MQRRTFLMLTPFASPSLLAGCSAREQAIRIAYHPWIGYETLFLASQFDWLPPAAALSRLDSGSLSLASLRRGEADAAALTIDEVIRARLGGMDLVVVMVFDVSSGGDVLLADEGVNALSELAGKRIGVEIGGVGEMLLDRVLARAGLGWDEVTVVDRSPHQHLNAWRNGDVDALVSYEPVASKLVKAGARRLIDSRDFPDLIFDVLAVRRDRLKGVGHALTDVIRAHFKALSHLRINLPDAVYRIADVQRIPEEVVMHSIAGVLLPDLESNRSYLSNGSRLIDTIRTLYPRLSNGGQPPSPAAIDDWVTDEYLPRGARA